MIPNTVVKFAPARWSDDYLFKQYEHVLFLGEIPNMPGHCAVVDSNGKVYWGMHTDDYIEVPQDEM